MKEVFGDLWSYQDTTDPSRIARVITTNSTVYDGEAVMGGGCALEAKRMWPRLPKHYAHLLRYHGHVVFALPPYTLGPALDVHKTEHTTQPFWVLLMPVKNHVRDKAETKLIRQSASQIEYLRRALDLQEIIVPRPGCGLGGLSWVTIRKLLKEKWPSSAYKVIGYPDEEES